MNVPGGQPVCNRGTMGTIGVAETDCSVLGEIVAWGGYGMVLCNHHSATTFERTRGLASYNLGRGRQDKQRDVDVG